MSRELAVIDGGRNKNVDPFAEPGELTAVGLDLAAMSDDELLARLRAVEEEMDHVQELLGGIRRAARAEVENRILMSGGRALAHPDFEKIELEDEFGPYAFDAKTLAAARALLPEDEKAKVLIDQPETTIVVPAKQQTGNPVSIAALIRKYGEYSEVGALLKAGMTRAKTGTRLVIKRRKPALPVGGNV